MSLRDVLKKRAAGTNYGGYFKLPDGIPLLRVTKPGIYNWDILPTEVKLPNMHKIPIGQFMYDRTILVHSKVGIDEKQIICPRSFGDKCPICEEYFHKMKDGVDKKNIDYLRPREHQFFYVVETKDRESGIKLLYISSFNFGKGLLTRVQEGDEIDSRYWEFFSLTEGLTVRANFTEQKANGQTFYKCEKPDLIERKQQYDENYMNGIPSIDDILVRLSYDDVLALLQEPQEDIIHEEAETIPWKEEKKEIKEDEGNVCPAPDGEFGNVGAYDECDKCTNMKNCAIESRK